MVRRLGRGGKGSSIEREGSEGEVKRKLGLEFCTWEFLCILHFGSGDISFSRWSFSFY